MGQRRHRQYFAFESHVKYDAECVIDIPGTQESFNNLGLLRSDVIIRQSLKVDPGRVNTK